MLLNYVIMKYDPLIKIRDGLAHYEKVTNRKICKLIDLIRLDFGVTIFYCTVCMCV